MAKVRPGVFISHWSTLIEGLQASPMEFYQAVEAEIERREVPDVKISRTTWKEAGMLSAKREYLRVHRKELFFDICAAPFGTGFFVSWWLAEPAGCMAAIAEIPYVGAIFEVHVKGLTYYTLDTTAMFQTAIHQAVLEVVDEVMKSKGLRMLTEGERKPIMKELMRR